jgi:arylsulfatase
VDGVLVTQGGRFGGYAFYVLKGKPVFLWNLLDLERVRWEAPEALAPGKHTLVFDFKYDGGGLGKGGSGVLKVDGKEVAKRRMDKTLPFILQWDEAFNVGIDTGTPVDDRDYKVPFAFTGKINKITLSIDRPKLSPEDIKKLEMAQRNNKTSE